jgi:hypothetical protein
MKKALSILLFAITLSCTTTKPSWQLQVPTYKPESKELYDSIVHMDSVWQDSYNFCKLEVQDLLISDSLEFYHDRNGVMTSKTALIAALKNNVCGKVTRELLAGSIEVYPIHNYGAVEMGYHRFHNKIEKTMSNFARFVHIWRQENGQWKMTRIISLH